MDYLSATRIVRNSTCKCGAGLYYRIVRMSQYGELTYEVVCSVHPRHQGIIPQPTNRDAWAESFKRQEKIMKGENNANEGR